MSQVTLKNVRFSYAYVFEPREDDERYSLTILVPKDEEATVVAMEAAIEAAKQRGRNELWKGKLPGNLSVAVHDGDGQRPSGDDFGPECKGHYVMTAKSKKKPGVVGRKREPLQAEDFYSGCHGNAAVTFYPYDTNGNRGVALLLRNVQKLRDGYPLGGMTRPEDDFDIEDDDDDDFLGN